MTQKRNRRLKETDAQRFDRLRTVITGSVVNKYGLALCRRACTHLDSVLKHDALTWKQAFKIFRGRKTESRSWCIAFEMFAAFIAGIEGKGERHARRRRS